MTQLDVGQERRPVDPQEPGQPTDDLLPGVGEGAVMPFRDVLRAGGRRTLVVLTALAAMDELDRTAFAVLAPDIQRDLGLSDLALGLMAAVGGLLLFVAAVPLGALADRRRRTTIIGVCTLAWAGAAVLTGLVRNGAEMFAARVVAGVGKANETPVQNAVLADAYPIEGRNRVYAVHRASGPVGSILGPVLAGGVAATVGGTAGWRWAFVVLAVPAVVLGVLALLLPEPVRGINEQREVLGEELAPAADEVPLSAWASFARLRRVPTFNCLLVALGALGFGVVAAPVYVNLVLEDEFGLGAGGRGTVASIVAVGGLLGVALAGRKSETLFKRSPEASLRLTGRLIVVYGLIKPTALFMPSVALYVSVEFVAQALLMAALVPTLALTAAVTPYRLRSMAFATVGLYLSLLGGIGGTLVVGLLAQAVGPRAAIALALPPAVVVGGVLMVRGARSVLADMATVARELLEERDARQVADSGVVLPQQVRPVDLPLEELPTPRPARPRPASRSRTAGGSDLPLSKAQLLDRARELDVRGRSRMSKQELLDALHEAERGDRPD